MFNCYRLKLYKNTIDFDTNYHYSYNDVFTLHELKQAIKVSCDTSTGIDIVHYQLQLQHSLNRLGDENGFEFSPSKTMCVHFCQLRKHHFDPQLYLNGTQIPTIGEAKFLGLIFDSKRSFIPHITSIKSRCTKSLDLIKVLSNTTWGADRKVLLRSYRALIRSKLDYGCIVYGSARPSYIKQLDTVHKQGLRLCLGAFRTSPVQILYVERMRHHWA